MFPTEAAAATDSDVGVFKPSPFNPSSPGSRPGAREYDCLVPVEVVFGQEGPKHSERVNFRVETRLPEGGTSGLGSLSPSVGAMLGGGDSRGYASFVVARPACAIATLDVSSGPGAGHFNMNKVVTSRTLAAGLFMVTGARATRLEDEERVEESAPGFSLTIVGEPPGVGQTKTYSGADVLVTLSTRNDEVWNAYVADSEAGRGNVTVTLTGREDGTFKGRMQGALGYPDPGVEGDYSFSGVNMTFISGPIGDDDETFQCF